MFIRQAAKLQKNAQGLWIAVDDNGEPFGLNGMVRLPEGHGLTERELTHPRIPYQRYRKHFPDVISTDYCGRLLNHLHWEAMHDAASRAQKLAREMGRDGFPLKETLAVIAAQFPWGQFSCVRVPAKFAWQSGNMDFIEHGPDNRDARAGLSNRGIPL